ncbi:MAG: TIGR03086 family protein [Actinomycetia bacterium]|nr:TIGR03086 family protein [Actinomycetes bacterium]MCP4227662.1 TIGR03086 family protein [Actinomycetes bacterium]MCP5034756.1 TIGR03086 family protein [Actinomycetes bacterium]
MSENLRTYVKALYGFDATVARVSTDSWANPSPCPGWTAADVVAHNIGMNNMIAGFAQAVGAGRPTEARPDDPGAEWGRSLDGLLDALDSDGALQTVAKTPWGEMAVDKFLGFAWVDPVIHTWDLARASGQEPIMDEALSQRAVKQLKRAGDSLRGEGRFGPGVDTSDAAPIIDQLVAISGRDPSAH